MLKKATCFSLLVLVLFSCKTNSVATGATATTMSANKVIKNHYNNDFDKETMTAKMKVKVKGRNDLPGVTGSLRLEKDKAIWISISKLGFSIGKVLITKDKVSYYEKINRTYFEGDFSLLSNWLGTDLDFDKVQNLLLGQAILNLKKEKYDIDVQEANYVLKPKKLNELFGILFMINPANFKVNRQQVQEFANGKTLIIDYKDYEIIDKQIFPKKIHINALDGKYTTSVDVDYRAIEFNRTVSFPFTIPSGYKEIVLK